MKITAISLSILGLLCTIMAVLAAFGVVPNLLNGVMSLSADATNILFWGWLAGLLFLGGISFGVCSIREL